MRRESMTIVEGFIEERSRLTVEWESLTDQAAHHQAELDELLKGAEAEMSIERITDTSQQLGRIRRRQQAVLGRLQSIEEEIPQALRASQG